MHQRTGRGRTIQKTCCVIIFCVCPFAATMLANGDPMNLLVKPFALLVHFLFFASILVFGRTISIRRPTAAVILKLIGGAGLFISILLATFVIRFCGILSR